MDGGARSHVRISEVSASYLMVLSILAIAIALWN